jgi:hypothetical protein
LRGDGPSEAIIPAIRYCCTSDQIVPIGTSLMFWKIGRSSKSKQNELIKAHYAGAVVLLVAAAGFLALVFVLNRAFDFSRFVY